MISPRHEDQHPQSALGLSPGRTSQAGQGTSAGHRTSAPSLYTRTICAPGTDPEVPCSTDQVNASARWVLDRVRPTATRLNASNESFNAQRFTTALSASRLKDGAKRTMLSTLDSADHRGITRESGRAIAAAVGKTPTTVSVHWDSARSCGLLYTRRRFNQSSIQWLSWPGRVIPEVELSFGTPIPGHLWTDAELTWWEQGGEPPWGMGPPPF